MQRRGTIALLLAVLVMGTLLWREGMPELEPPKEQPEQEVLKPLLPDFDPNSVLAIRLWNGEQQRSIDKPGDGWQASDVGKRAFAFLVGLKDLGRVHEIAVAETDLPDFGLAPPDKRLELEASQPGSKVSIEVGEHNPSTTGVYVRLDQKGDVILAGALLEWEFDKLWRDLE